MSRKATVIWVVLWLVAAFGFALVTSWPSGSAPEPESSVSQSVETEQTSGDYYIGNANTKKFHYPSCTYLPDLVNQVILDTREEAVSKGYSPCGHCNP